MKLKDIDLSKLSTPQKLQLFDLVEEQEKRLKKKKLLYVPNEGQNKVHSSQKIERIVTAGNGFGKTATLIHEVVWNMQGFNPARQEWIPVPNKNIILLDSPEKVEKLYIPELHKWFNTEDFQFLKHGKPHITEITYKNGSSMQFYFQQQEPLVFESVQIDGIIAIDEPCPRWQYVALRRGGRVKNRQTKVLIVGTPIAQPWLRTDIIEPWSRGELPDTECFKFGTALNEKNLSHGYMEQFSKILTEQEKKVRLEGEFFDLSGLALSHIFDRIIHVVPDATVPTDQPCVLAIDPHPSKAHVCVLLTVDENGFLYVVNEAKQKLPARRFAEFLHDFMEPYRIIDIVVDSLGSTDGTGGEGFKSFIQVLQEEGIRARATTWEEKQDEAFISRIQDALLVPSEPNFGTRHLPKLRVFASCRGLIHDIENVQWLKIKNSDENKPKLDIANKDFLACLKYALATNLSPLKTKSKMYLPKTPAYGLKKEPAQVRKMRVGIRNFLTRRKKAIEEWNNDD